MNTIGKIIDVVIAQRLNCVAETYHVLPSTHMGGSKMRSTEYALHAVTSKIYEAWGQKDKLSSQPPTVGCLGRLRQRLTFASTPRPAEEKSGREDGNMDCKLSQQRKHKYRYRRIPVNTISDQYRHTPRITTLTHSLPLLQCRSRRKMQPGERQNVHRVHRPRWYIDIGQDYSANMRCARKGSSESTKMGKHTRIRICAKQILTNCKIYMLKNDAVKMWCVNLIDFSVWFYRLGCPLFRRVVLVMSYVVLLWTWHPAYAL